jgi:hypothetical protein
MESNPEAREAVQGRTASSVTLDESWGVLSRILGLEAQMAPTIEGIRDLLNEGHTDLARWVLVTTLPAINSDMALGDHERFVDAIFRIARSRNN